MKRDFGAEKNRKVGYCLRFRGIAWNAVSSCDGPGSSPARRPSAANTSGCGESVRYHQSGLRVTASRPFRWTARRGNPGRFLEQ